MKIKIEPAEAGDALKLIDVQNRAFQEDFEKYGECPAYNESLEAMRERIQNAIVYKVTSGGEIIGDIIVRRRENNRYYLRVIAVVPEHWDRGVGTMAMNFIEKEMADASEWSLITPHQSIRNHHFYEKLGFQKTGETVHSELLILWEYKKKTTL